MKSILIYTVLLLVLMLTGCSAETDKAAIQPHAAGKTTPILNLNNGQKWRADEATTSSILNMQQAMETFIMKADFSSAKAYQQLGQELRGELNNTYRNCTMTGSAHVELHKFLVPIEDDVKILLGEDAKAASNAQLRIEERLMMYQTFFD
ncbi:MAG: hypothetical protein LPJ89_01695 [Hymenobacteraceae bacterium]|nr:hypothetical protein [Hymenobacteraceae bacterium]MDX5397895.1 hypothetical protein [Hymenobacteraceae bacterium]MDX5442476.1 hypothetical protein [Hymenobacteraceae bacterium]MDX5513966.1 hypothetical protein [Hymenobacteraceae bacterium]